MCWDIRKSIDMFLDLVLQIDRPAARLPLAFAGFDDEAVQIVAVGGGKLVLDPPDFAEHVVSNRAFRGRCGDIGFHGRFSISSSGVQMAGKS